MMKQKKKYINIFNTNNTKKLNVPYNLEYVVTKKIWEIITSYINSWNQILIHIESFMKSMNNKIGVIKNKKLSITYKFYNIIKYKV